MAQLSHPDVCRSFVNRLTMPESVAVLSCCQTFIGNDTGTLHIAAATELPILTPNCFAASIPMTADSNPRVYAPDGVPSVVVQPPEAKDDCARLAETTPYGARGCCHFEEPHCIKGIEVEDMLAGLRILRQQIADGARKPAYYHRENTLPCLDNR